MQIAITALAAIFVVLIALKLWARTPVKAAAKPAPAGGFEFRSLVADIDDEVRKAERWWPHLKVSVLFWVAAFFTLILLMLDFHFGFSRGGWGGLIVLGSLFGAADVAIPIIALQMETAGVSSDDIERRTRPVMSWVLLVGCTIMSCIVVIGSTAELSTVIGAAKAVEAVDYKSALKNIEQWELERDKIPVDRGFKALDELAKSAEEAANREAGRVKCGQKCEALKGEATALRARANDAKRKEELIAKVGAEKARLEANGGGVRLDADPLATAIDAMTMGLLAREAVMRYAATVIGVALVCLVTLIWIIVGDGLHFAIARDLKRRGGIADDARRNLGLPAKYTAPEPAGLLTKPEPAGDTITINVSTDAMLKRYANDAALIEVNALFDSLIERAEDGRVMIGDMYRAYRVAVLSANHEARYLTQPVFAQKLVLISQHRDDVRVTADGAIVGWILKAKEAENASG